MTLDDLIKLLKDKLKDDISQKKPKLRIIEINITEGGIGDCYTSTGKEKLKAINGSRNKI